MNPFGKAEYLLIAGFAMTAAGTALAQLVLIGLIGLALAPFALILLFLGGIYAHDVSLPRPRTLMGLVLFIAGILALGYSAVRAGSIGYSTIIHLFRPSLALPSALQWTTLFLWCALAAVFVSFGLALRTRWARSRIAFWAVVTFCVPFLGLLLLFVLATVFPITA